MKDGQGWCLMVCVYEFIDGIHIRPLPSFHSCLFVAFFLKTLRASCQTKVSKTLSALNGSSRRSHLFDITYAHKDILAATLPVATWYRHCCWDWILDFIECSSFFSCKEMFGSLPPLFLSSFERKRRTATQNIDASSNFVPSGNWYREPWKKKII